MLFQKKKSLFFLFFCALAVGTAGCDGRAPLPEASLDSVSDAAGDAERETGPISDDTGEEGDTERVDPGSPGTGAGGVAGDGRTDAPVRNKDTSVHNGDASAHNGDVAAHNGQEASLDSGVAGQTTDGAAVGRQSGKGRPAGDMTGLDLTVCLGSDLYSMDPAQAIHDLEKTLLLHVYETLLIHDQDGRLIPGQAQSYEVSQDGLTYTFHLREGLKWSDGSPLTASDLVYSWKRLVDYSTASPYAKDLLGVVKGYQEAAENAGRGLGVSAKDAHTLVVTLTEPCPGFLQSCAHPALSPVKKSSVEAPVTSSPGASAERGDKAGAAGATKGADWSLSVDALVGNGPMKLDAMVEGESIRFVKNENYRDQEKVSLRSITFLLSEDQEEIQKQLLEGKVQLMLCDAAAPGAGERLRRLRRTGRTAKGAKRQAEVEERQAPKTGTYHLVFNQRLEAFQDPRVRTALSMVLDREAIADTVMEGNVLPARSLIGPGISDEAAGSSFWETTQGSSPNGSLDDSSDDRPDDGPDEQTWETAKALLSQAGYPNGSGLPVIELLTNDSGYHIALGRYLQSTWGRLGVQLKIRKITWQYFTPSRHSGDFMIARASWLMDTDDPLPFLEQFTTDHPLNDSHYSNPQVDAAINTAKTATDKHTYYQALHKAEQLILEDGAAIPIAYYQDTWIQAGGLEGICHMADGTWKFVYASQQAGGASKDQPVP